MGDTQHKIYRTFDVSSINSGTGNKASNIQNAAQINQWYDNYAPWSDGYSPILLVAIITFNTLEPKPKGHYFADGNFKLTFMCETVLICFPVNWQLLPRVQLTISHHRFRLWLGAEMAPSLYVYQWWPGLLTHKCVMLLWWVTISASVFNVECTSDLFSQSKNMSDWDRKVLIIEMNDHVWKND